MSSSSHSPSAIETGNEVPAFKVMLLGVARPGFDTDLAARYLERTATAIETAGGSLVRPDGLLTEPIECLKWMDENAGFDADALVLQLSTFVDGRFPSDVAANTDLPILLWGIPEPETQGRLRLNSLTGLNSASYVIGRLGRTYEYVYRNPEQGCPSETVAWLRSAAVNRQLKSARIGVVGAHPAGFFASAIDPIDLQSSLGPTVVALDLESLFREAAVIPEEQWKPYLDKDQALVSGLRRLNLDQLRKSTQFEIALRTRIASMKLDAVAVRCWPEFINPYGAAACSTLAHLNDAQVPAACEADVLGAVSMLIQNRFTQTAVFLGDLVHVSEERNSAIFWHCGAGAISLASPRTGAVAGVQPNRNVAYALDNPLMPGRVTIFRVGQTKDGLRMIVATGTARDDGGHFFGTSVEVVFDDSVTRLLPLVIGEGFEFHFSIVWRDIRQELVHLASLTRTPMKLL